MTEIYYYDSWKTKHRFGAFRDHDQAINFYKKWTKLKENLNNWNDDDWKNKGTEVRNNLISFLSSNSSGAEAGIYPGFQRQIDQLYLMKFNLDDFLGKEVHFFELEGELVGLGYRNFFGTWSDEDNMIEAIEYLKILLTTLTEMFKKSISIERMNPSVMTQQDLSVAIRMLKYSRISETPKFIELQEFISKFNVQPVKHNYFDPIAIALAIIGNFRLTKNINFKSDTFLIQTPEDDENIVVESKRNLKIIIRG